MGGGFSAGRGGGPGRGSLGGGEGAGDIYYGESYSLLLSGLKQSCHLHLKTLRE